MGFLSVATRWIPRPAPGITTVLFRGFATSAHRTVKGREWYQADAIAERYEEKRFSGGGRLIDRRERQAVLDAVAPADGKRILEIACGTGRFSVMLAERRADVTGFDISAPMLARARAKVRAASVGDRVEFVRGDAARLPFEDDHFDVVCAVRFFHLADTPARFLSEMRRVTRRTVFFDTFNARSARSVYNWLLPMGSRLYTREEVDQLLDDTGLELASATHDFVVPYGVYRSLPGEIAGPLRTLDTGVQRTPVGRELASVSYWTADVA